MRSISCQVLLLSILSGCSTLLGFHSRIFAAPWIRSSSGGLRSTIIDDIPSLTSDLVPANGIINYIGKSSGLGDESEVMLDSPLDVYKKPSSTDLFLTRFALWRQLPWKKISGKVILSAKIGGDLRLSSAPPSPFSAQDVEVVSSLEEIDNLFRFAAYDPRVEAVLLDINSVQCGYAKLIEIRRRIDFFKKSGKPVIAYCTTGGEKEFFLSLSCDEVYVPPEGGFDLRGFSSSNTFVRGVLDKLGIEPQVERIGKYKSAGDSINRYNISEAQREVVSSLLMEASDSWVRSVSSRFNMSESGILGIWASKTRIKSQDLRRLGLVNGILYQDQVHDKLKERFRSFSSTTKFVMSMRNISEADLAREFTDFDLDDYFKKTPRRSLVGSSPMNKTLSSLDSKNESTASTSAEAQSAESDSREKKIAKIKEKAIYPSLFPAGKYLKKMRKGDRILKGLPVKKVRYGPRIAVINAIGAINSGKSSSGNNPSIGSDTLIEMVRECRTDKSILGVVIRVDSPGGSALASDLMWREIRELSSVKPVVASQVDVAASGGYYISMACDQIVAEELTITGSIGVVLAKFNANELNSRLGLGVETISRGRFAELLATSRGFTAEENDYFSGLARDAYKDFVSKAAASRNMTFEAMNEVAQGRVWTGRQGKAIGLVDHLGGLSTAVEIVRRMVNATDAKKRLDPLRIEVMEAKGRPFPFALLSSASAESGRKVQSRPEVMASCDAFVFDTELVSPESVGCGSELLKNLGLPSSLRVELEHFGGFDQLLRSIETSPSAISFVTQIVRMIGNELF